MKNKEYLIKYGDPRTYYDYLKLKDVNTKHFLMFAELIDNSISSFENVYEDNWEKQLEIKININFEGNTKKMEDFKVVGNSFISFSDNAFGIGGEKNIKNAIKLNNRYRLSSTKSKMNVHGRGLKQCAFFYGVDLTLETTSEKYGTWKTSTKLSDQTKYGINSYFLIIPKKLKQESNIGTKILIENIYLDRIFSFGLFENIILALNYRYINYLKDKKIDITFKMKNSDGKTKSKKLTLPEEPKAKVSDKFDIKSLSEEKFNSFMEKAKTYIFSPKSKQAIFDQEVMTKTYEKIKELLISERQKGNKYFEWKQKILIENNFLNFVFWSLPKYKKSHRGIRLFDGKRAIKHPGYNEPETLPYMGWFKTMTTGSTHNRFAGKCDLSELKLIPKTDKSTFNFSDKQTIELNNKILSVYKVFDVFELQARQEEKDEKTKKWSKKSQNTLNMMADTKFPHEDLSYDKEETKKAQKIDKNAGPVFRFVDRKQKEWFIFLKEDNDEQTKIIYKPNRIASNQLEIVIYTSHIFWKTINSQVSFHNEVLWPLTLLFAMLLINDGNIEESFDEINNVIGNFEKKDCFKEVFEDV